ncbi:MAG: RIP metalloprotease RseP [Calditrichaeota bacterium]|nr:MAG: RIP metalloprotease RseP [Calditrichota bacterium]
MLNIFGFVGNYILPIIIVLGVLVLVHELGHFLAAKLFGVRVERFSIGFPPRLFGIKIGDTDYCISAIPLGGYVKMSGMIDESMDASTLTGAPHEFMSKPTWQKVIIITAGVIMNFLLAVVILGGALWMQGEAVLPTTTIGIVQEGGIADSIGLKKYDKILSINDTPVNNWQDIESIFLKHLGSDLTFVVERNGVPLTISLKWENLKLNDMERFGIGPLLPAVVGELTPGYPAQEAGLKPGDRILAIQDSSIESWTDMTTLISNNPEVPLTFTIQRGDSVFQTVITPKAVSYEDEEGNTQKRGLIGIGYKVLHKEISLPHAMYRGYQRAVLFGKLNITGFMRLISGEESTREMLMGPIGIAKVAGDYAQAGYENLILLIAYLSVVLAIINILPIPALDGGHLVIILIEGIRKKPLPVKTKMIIQQIGMVILLMLIFFVIFNDINRLFSGN